MNCFVIQYTVESKVRAVMHENGRLQKHIGMDPDFFKTA